MKALALGYESIAASIAVYLEQNPRVGGGSLLAVRAADMLS